MATNGELNYNLSMDDARMILVEELSPKREVLLDDEFEDEMRVTVIATGFESKVTSAPVKTEAAAGAAEVVASAGDIGDIDEIFNIFKR